MMNRKVVFALIVALLVGIVTGAVAQPVVSKLLWLTAILNTMTPYMANILTLSGVEGCATISYQAWQRGTVEEFADSKTVCNFVNR